jgi:hypothetical protein
MRRHEAVGEAEPAVLPHRGVDQAELDVPVVDVGVDRTVAVAVRPNVIDRVGELEARRTWHLSTVTARSAR